EHGARKSLRSVALDADARGTQAAHVGDAPLRLQVTRDVLQVHGVKLDAAAPSDLFPRLHVVHSAVELQIDRRTQRAKFRHLQLRLTYEPAVIQSGVGFSRNPRDALDLEIFEAHVDRALLRALGGHDIRIDAHAPRQLRRAQAQRL